jgi:hypothetical protein
MTHAEEERFVTLWNAGTETAVMAQALGIPRGTVSSRAYTLVRQGKIAPRPKGGNYPRSRRQEGAPAPTRDPPVGPTREAPASPPAITALPTREAPAITMVAVPELRELINRFSTLEARVVALEDGTREAPRTPPAPASPPAPRVRLNNGPFGSPSHSSRR